MSCHRDMSATCRRQNRDSDNSVATAQSCATIMAAAWLSAFIVIEDLFVREIICLRDFTKRENTHKYDLPGTY
eukprot:scaffold148432_cov34-Cyclotella_meneghiniana.AAC.1